MPGFLYVSVDGWVWVIAQVVGVMVGLGVIAAACLFTRGER